MRVDVSLCGSIPRSQMHCRGIKSFSPGTSDGKAECIMSLNALLPKHRRGSNDSTVSQSAAVEPPSWAVPARGESILEPVNGGLHVQAPVNLGTEACFRFGRSESSDVQLLHSTSSRHHAILFHHPNGSCYIIDCGSSHGTYVNGVRVRSGGMSSTENCDTPYSSDLVPFRVKKGALIRFGGQGAPVYVLKSFSIGIDSLFNNVDGKEVFICKENVIEDEPPTAVLHSRSNENISNDSIVTLNTRLNAMGGASMQMLSEKCLPALARARLKAQTFSKDGITPFLKKRSFSSIPRSVSTDDEPVRKKTRMFMCCKLSNDSPSINKYDDIAIISPSRSKSSFTLNNCDTDRPVVSPNPLDGAGDLELDCCAKSVLMVPLTLNPTEKKRVQFCDELQVFHSHPVSPESSSD